MAEGFLEFFHRVGVAFRGVWVDRGGAAAVDAFLDDSGGGADADGFAEPGEFGPGGDVFDVNVGAETAFVARSTCGGFQRAEGAEADEADDLAAVVAKTVVFDMVEARGLARGAQADFVSQEAIEEVGEVCLAGWRKGRGCKAFAGGEGDGEEVRDLVETGLQFGEFGVAEEAGEIGFGDPGGSGGVEGGVTLGQGEGAVPGDAAAGGERGGGQRLGRQAFDGVAPERFDFHHWFTS